MAKVRLTYTPEGGSKRVWEFDNENPPWDVTFATEKATDWPWGEFSQKLAQGSVIALRALIWTLRRRDEQRLDINSVQVLYGEVDVEELDEPSPDTADGDAVEDPKEV